MNNNFKSIFSDIKYDTILTSSSFVNNYFINILKNNNNNNVNKIDIQIKRNFKNI